MGGFSKRKYEGNNKKLGGTMRLGAQECSLVTPSLAYNLYKKNYHRDIDTGMR